VVNVGYGASCHPMERVSDCYHWQMASSSLPTHPEDGGHTVSKTGEHHLTTKP